jgi:hypothetical protein
LSTFFPCLGYIAPYYNLVLVAVLVALFIYFFAMPNKHKIYDTHWKLIFCAIMIFIVEEIMTVLKAAGLITFPSILFAFFEMAMISLFLYMCLLQKERLKHG